MLAHHADAHALLPVDTSPARRRKAGLLAIIAAAFFLSADVTITNIALPSIARELRAPMADLQWVVDSYNIVLAGLLLLGAGLGERHGRRRAFLAGVTIFALGSLTAGLAGSVGQLVTGRTIMGIGAALLLAPAIGLIAALFPPDERGPAVAAWAAAGGLGLAVAPLAGGVILTFLPWNALFLMNVPVMAATVALGAWALPRAGDEQGKHLDVVGAVLSVTGFAAFLGALIEAPRAGWNSPLVLAGLTVGALLIAGFALWELRREDPMIELRILAQRGTLGASVALFVSYVSFTGSLFLASQQLQGGLGLDDIALGVALAPFAMVFWLLSRKAGAFAARVGEGRCLVAGSAIMTAAFAVAGATVMMRSPVLVAAALCFAAIGWAMVIPVGSVVILNDVPTSLTGAGSGMSMLARFIGASFGIAILGTVVATVIGNGPAHDDPEALLAGIGAASWAGAVLAALGTLACLPLLWRWVPSGTGDAAAAAAAGGG